MKHKAFKRRFSAGDSAVLTGPTGEVPVYFVAAENDAGAQRATLPLILQDVTWIKAHGNTVIGELFAAASGANRFALSDVEYAVTKVTPLRKGLKFDPQAETRPKKPCAHTWVNVYDTVRMQVNRQTEECHEVERERSTHRIPWCAQCGSKVPRMQVDSMPPAQTERVDAIGTMLPEQPAQPSHMPGITYGPGN